MPDALRLDSPEDRMAFRRWFTFLAEIQFFQGAGRLPTEINDCAALLRYSYREALRAHDARWSAEAGLPLVVALPSVQKYQYPRTILGASLFRVRPGRLRAEDFANATFSQFADAKTLQSINTHFVSRDVKRAEPGDLLFFKHEAAGMPFHAMIYLGRSQVRDSGAEAGKQYVVYHTGPDGAQTNAGGARASGEIRRPSLEELMVHPNPGWRPLPGNPTFLGVYRWNILRR
jgi:uncharacterized protein YfaT (DUF1175 family)